ncbi:MAG: hypothetical protein M4579_001021 [Chaenotheca gracillima]|nr:MAG: hypothetical protein M4579_001021 [Chaenotheca gracillima]
MPAQPETRLSVPFSPTFTSRQRKSPVITELEFTPSSFDDELDIFSTSGDMAGVGSPDPSIKEEHDDSLFNMNSSHRFQQSQQPNFNMAQQQQSQQSANGFSNMQGASGSINPSDLTVQNGSFLSSYPNYGSQQNHFDMGNSGIADDELLDLGNLDEPSPRQHPQQQQAFQGGPFGFSGQQNMPVDQAGPEMFQNNNRTGSLAMAQSNQIYSSTPEGAPINSPFVNPGFHYAGYRQQNAQSQQFGNALDGPSSYNASQQAQAGSHSGSYEGGFINGARPKALVRNLDRQGSHSRSPLTPKTPAMGMGAMNLGTPESGSFPTQPIHTHNPATHRHKTSMPNQWDGTPGSLQSYAESPVSSPGHPSHHTQISEIFKSGKHASLPAKVENGPHSTGPVPGFQSQEAKRRRRRESHNLVERRRRDNINERIQELSHLVPMHRLEDEKVRKHLVNNSPLSPTVGATGISPPQATSLLAGGSGKRAAGNITTGIPIEDKDKGPNKGDILNGSVSWTRDLMWSLYCKLQQESELADYITSLGGTFPFEQTEEERRMRTELLDAMEKNDASSFSYSRGPGSGLRVPKHTNISGEPSNGNQNDMSPQSLSPANQSGADSAGTSGGNYWGMNTAQNMDGPASFKEEDEYMPMVE